MTTQFEPESKVKFSERKINLASLLNFPLGLSIPSNLDLSNASSWCVRLGVLDGSNSNSKSTFWYPPKVIPYCSDISHMLFTI